jgi:predicted metal-dependent peptidase
MKTVSKLDKAKASIVLDHPFFASILLRRPMKFREDIPWFAIDNRGTIYVNPKSVEGLSVPEIVWGLCHECLHYMGQHMNRKQGRDHKRWNRATDAWANDTLTSAGIGQAIANTVNMPGSKDKTCEEIYAEMPEGDEGGGGGDGEGGGDNGGGMGDDILDEGKPVTESEAKEMAAHAKIEVAEAAQAAKMRGKMPGALAEFVADFLESKTPWFTILERHMIDMTSQESSWMRPNRRFIGAGTYLPSMAKAPSMGEIVVQVDVSGSISRDELAAYNGHLSRIHSQCKPSKTHVIYTDTQVQKHVEFGPDDEVALEFFSGGGTHMPAGFDWCAAEGITPAVLVTLTDGYTGFDEDPGYPTIWCISSDVRAPYGETVHFDMNDK